MHSYCMFGRFFSIKIVVVVREWVDLQLQMTNWDIYDVRKPHVAAFLRFREALILVASEKILDLSEYRQKNIMSIK